MRSLLCALLLGLAVACAGSGPVLRSDINPDVDFSRYRTFSFFVPIATEPEGSEDYQSPLTQRLKRSVRIELESRGYRYVHQGGDLLVNFFLNREDLGTVSTAGTPDGGYYAYRTGRYRTWPTHYETQAVRYAEGTLSIDLVDAALRLLVWNGTAEDELRDMNLQDRSDPTVSSAVATIFAPYPYQSSAAPPMSPDPAMEPAAEDGVPGQASAAEGTFP